MKVSDRLPQHTINTWSYASSRFNLSSSLSIEPIVSYTWRSNISRAEGGVLFYVFKSEGIDTYNDRFWIGGVYSSNHTFALMLGMSITSHLRIGYSVDYGLGTVSGISGFGTHEIFLAYHLNRRFYKDVCYCQYKDSYYKLQR
jgi:hypothetical protein